MKSIWSQIERILPILLKVTGESVTISVSRRFLLFDLLQRLKKKIEDDPYLNFISILRYSKVLGKSMTGELTEFYRDKDKLYFRKFFPYNETYERVKQDISEVYAINKEVKITIFKSGLLVYDNYKPGQFNVLLLTIHSGEFVPKDVEANFAISAAERYKEEDVLSDKLYRRIVLDQGGIWIDNKMSRFYVDLNRARENAIYKDGEQVPKLYEKPLPESQKQKILSFYDSFYVLLQHILTTYTFNLVFDGHTMRDGAGRPRISFFTHYIPKFYLPVVGSLKKKMHSLGYKDILMNAPYAGGYLVEWICKKHPAVFATGMEINKKIYMYPDRKRAKPSSVQKIAQDLVQVFDIEEEKGYRAGPHSKLVR